MPKPFNPPQEDLEKAAALYRAGSSIPDVAKEMGWAKATTRKKLIAHGVKMRPNLVALRMAGPKISKSLTGKKRGKYPPAWVEAIKAGRARWIAENASGLTKKADGYIKHTMGPDVGRGEHTTIMEARLGRPIKGDECVHHIAGNTSNNSENNLALVTKGGHRRIHNRDRDLIKQFIKDVFDNTTRRFR